MKAMIMSSDAWTLACKCRLLATSLKNNLTTKALTMTTLFDPEIPILNCISRLTAIMVQVVSSLQLPCPLVMLYQTGSMLVPVICSDLGDRLNGSKLNSSKTLEKACASRLAFLAPLATLWLLWKHAWPTGGEIPQLSQLSASPAGYKCQSRPLLDLLPPVQTTGTNHLAPSADLYSQINSCCLMPLSCGMVCYAAKASSCMNLSLGNIQKQPSRKIKINMLFMKMVK